MIKINKGTADPRLKLLCYLLWYIVIFMDNYVLLSMMFLIQISLFIVLGGYRTIYIHILGVLVIAGIVLSFISLAFTNQQVLELITILCRWGIIVIATFNLAIDTPSRDIFFALRFYHVPWLIIFTLGIAIRFIPITIDETRRCVMAFKARGIDFGKGYRAIWQAPKTTIRLLFPILINILDRGQRVWFSIELRGITHKLFVNSVADYNRSANIVVFLFSFIPIVSLLYYLLTK